jgi:hypothetical protein
VRRIKSFFNETLFYRLAKGTRWKRFANVLPKHCLILICCDAVAIAPFIGYRLAGIRFILQVFA